MSIEKRWDSDRISQPICNFCANYRPDLPGIACNAFPNGIPNLILKNGNLHDKPMNGDNGIQFEVDSLRENEYRNYLRRLNQ
jgi:hypothetical protein